MARNAKGNPQEVSKALRKEGVKATKFAAENFSIAVAMVLWDEGKHDSEQLSNTIQRINKLFDGIASNHVSIDDCKATLQKEAHYPA